MTKERIYLTVAKIISILFLSVAVINFNLLSIYNHLFLKLIIIFFGVAFIDMYIKEIYWLLNKIRKLSRTWTTIDGLNTKQIFNLLMSSNWLPAKKFFDYISTDKDVFKKLGDNLERVGILVRWEKNARVLNNQYTADQVFNILNSKTDSALLPTWFIKVWEWSYKFVNHRLQATEN